LDIFFFAYNAQGEMNLAQKANDGAMSSLRRGFASGSIGVGWKSAARSRPLSLRHQPWFEMSVAMHHQQEDRRRAVRLSVSAAIEFM
jgi:hypothetical protein